MTFIRNNNMEYLEIDENSLVIYDETRGDTHYINETGKTIVELLETATPKEDLIRLLCDIYSASTEEIEADVDRFLDELISKKVVVCL